MPQFDPWRGTNQGLATLRNTFDDLYTRRRREEEDALRRPILRNQAAMGELQLSEAQRKAEQDKAFREGLSSLESGFATSAVPAEVSNPDYRPATPEGLNSTLTYAGEANEVVPAKPAQGLPTMPGQRPMTENEKNNARIRFAMQQGNLDAVAKITAFADVTDKMDARATTRVTNMMKTIDSIRETMGPQVAKEYAKKMLIEQGMPPELADQIVISPQGHLSSPDGQGGTIITLRTPDGKYHVVHSKAKDESLDRERLSIMRERLALDRERLAKGGVGGRGGATALMKNTDFLVSLGYSKKEAAALLSSSKPMSRDTFIAQATLRVMNNTFIPEDEKTAAVQKAISIYDSNVKKGAAPTSSRVITEGVNYLKGAKNRDEAIKRIREMAKKGWSREDIAAAAKEAKWE